MLLSVTLAWLLMAHPMHVAYTNIEIDPASGNISVTHKVITEDFSLLFFHLFEKNVVPKPHEEFLTEEKKLIDHYMKYRFFLLSGKDTIRLQYQHKTLEDHTLWLNYSGKIPIPELNTLEINNMMFLDLNMDQTNLVIVNYGKIEKGLTFNWDNRQAMVALKE